MNSEPTIDDLKAENAALRESLAQIHAEMALRESEERGAFLLKLSDALRPLSDAASVKQVAMKLLAEKHQVMRAGYLDVHADGDTMTMSAKFEREVVPLPPQIRLSDYGSTIANAFRAGRTLCVRDAVAEAETEEQAAAHLAIGVQSWIIAPLVKGGRLMAIVGVVEKTPRDWTPTEIQLVTDLAERTWDTVQRARSEETLRESEGRFRALAEQTEAGVAMADCEGRLIWVNERLAEIVGRERDEMVRLTIQDCTHPDDWSENERLYRLMIEDGSPFVFEKRLGRAELATRWNRLSISPRRDDEGHIVGGVAVIIDITDRKRTELALRESEERFKQFANASSDVLWIRDAASLEMEYASAAFATIHGAVAGEGTEGVQHWAALIVPKDREPALAALEAAKNGHATVTEFRIRRPSDGAFRWVRNATFPLHDEQGRVRRIGGLFSDTTEARLSAEHQDVLLAELQHRVRNIMGMIRSMANRTAAGAAEINDYRSLLEGRLLALARVQALLTRGANVGGSLRSVLENEIAAQAHHTMQFELTGPDVMLSPKAVEVLTLAFHELATNALKYGALSVPDGQLTVNWTPIEKRDAPWLTLDWIESGAPPREPSKRRGFGSELIEGRIPYELRGTGKITIGPEGARCHMEFPLRDGESILETDAPQPTTVFGGSIDMTGAPDLSGKTVLVVEDDFYMAMDATVALQGAGADVLGPCSSEDMTRDLLEDRCPTHAVLDLNLGGGGPRFEIAHLLKSRGVPFIFLTGYDPEVIPDELADVVRLQKPVEFRAIVEAVSRL